VQNPARVRWGIATSLVYAWLLTIPAAALVAAGAYWLGRPLFR
jgi:PiT family inorganic phosphate transporter